MLGFISLFLTVVEDRIADICGRMMKLTVLSGLRLQLTSAVARPSL